MGMRAICIVILLAFISISLSACGGRPKARSSAPPQQWQDNDADYYYPPLPVDDYQYGSGRQGEDLLLLHQSQ